MQVEPRESGFRATLRIAPDFMLFPDHFAAGPILPGICLIQALLLAGAQSQRVDSLRLCHVKRAKFQAPAQAGDVVEIDAETTGNGNGEIGIRATLLTQGKKLAQISLVAKAEATSAGAGQ